MQFTGFKNFAKTKHAASVKMPELNQSYKPYLATLPPHCLD